MMPNPINTLYDYGYEKDGEEIVREVRKTKKRGSLRLKPGHSLFKFSNGGIEKVNLSKAAEINGGVRSEINLKEGELFIPALNKKNAIKRLKRHGINV